MTQDREWFPHFDFTGEPMREGCFRESFPMEEETARPRLSLRRTVMGSDLYHGQYPGDMTPDEARAELERREPKHSTAEQQRLNDRLEAEAQRLDAEAKRVMGSENEMVAVPQGMVPYGPDHPDYPNRPADCLLGEDGGVQWFDGKVARGAVDLLDWAHHTSDHPRSRDIIAYTPARLAPAQPVAQQGEAGRIAAELHDYAVLLRTWTMAHERSDGLRPLKQLLEDAAQAIATPSSPALDAATIERCAEVATAELNKVAVQCASYPIAELLSAIPAAIRALPNAEKRHG